MKRHIRTVAAAVIGLASLAGIAAADPIEGIWQTEVDDGAFAHVTVAPCGAGFCGAVSRTFTAAGEFSSPNVGKQIIREMVPQGGSDYEGRVWRPSNDKVYFGKVTLDGDRMALRGCVAGGLICARQTWLRVQ